MQPQTRHPYDPIQPPGGSSPFFPIDVRGGVVGCDARTFGRGCSMRRGGVGGDCNARMLDARMLDGRAGDVLDIRVARRQPVVTVVHG